jgi:hypothetical protein
MQVLCLFSLDQTSWGIPNMISTSNSVIFIYLGVCILFALIVFAILLIKDHRTPGEWDDDYDIRPD